MITAWQHRLPRRQPGLAGRRRSRRARLVAEATAVAAAVGGMVVFRQQASPRRERGLDLYTSPAPVLVAVPAVMLAMRLCPFVVRGLLRFPPGGPGRSAFLGLARAARGVVTPALPAFALVLALTLAAFTGMSATRWPGEMAARGGPPGPT